MEKRMDTTALFRLQGLGFVCTRICQPIRRSPIHVSKLDIEQPFQDNPIPCDAKSTAGNQDATTNEKVLS